MEAMEGRFKKFESAYGTQDAAKRMMAVLDLGRQKDPETIPLLEKAAGDQSTAIRAHVARVIGEIGHQRGIPALRILLADKEQLVKTDAIKAINSVARSLAARPPKEIEGNKLAQALASSAHELPKKTAESILWLLEEAEKK
jgi:HEAT repeat protein